MSVSGFVNEATCSGEGAVLVARGCGLNRQHLPPGETVSERVCIPGERWGPQSCLEALVLKGSSWRYEANNLGSPHGMLQSAFVPRSGSSIPDGNGGGEDGLSTDTISGRLNFFIWQDINVNEKKEGEEDDDEKNVKKGRLGMWCCYFYCHLCIVQCLIPIKAEMEPASPQSPHMLLLRLI